VHGDIRDPVRIAAETYLLPATLPVPGRGLQYLNPMLVRGAEPLLVDTGAAVLGDEYFAAVGQLIDLGDVRWIFVSHDDRDHTGGLLRLLELCPRARVITSFQAVNRMTKEIRLPLDRMVFADVGDSVPIGDRSLRLVRPPMFDSPATRGFWDDRTGVYYAVDAFGAVTPGYQEFVTDGRRADYHAGFDWLNRANTPWLALVDPAKLAAVVGAIRALRLGVLASYHGPVAVGPEVEWLCDLALTIPVEQVEFPSLDAVAAELVQ
jgi:flavorubredoxin